MNFCIGQVLRYDVGEEYEGHYDYFFHKEGTANGGNRFLTVGVSQRRWCLWVPTVLRLAGAACWLPGSRRALRGSVVGKDHCAGWQDLTDL